MDESNSLLPDRRHHRGTHPAAIIMNGHNQLLDDGLTEDLSEADRDELDKIQTEYVHAFSKLVADHLVKVSDVLSRSRAFSDEAPYG